MASPSPDLVFKAFADPTRLRILRLLQREEMCVGDLVKTLRIPQPKASRHLNYLRRAGLVTSRKDGLWRHYALAPARGSLHSRLLECLSSCFETVPGVGGDSKRARALKKAGGCC